MYRSFSRRWVTPAILPVGVIIVLAVLIIAIGEILLNNADHHLSQESPRRIELWVAGLLSLGIIGVAGFVASRPSTGNSLLEREVVMGKSSIFAEEIAPISIEARTGELGTVADISEGYTLYARSGALARVIGIVGGSEEFGRRFRGFMYAQGLHGASDELWIPYEAVMAVYPETRSAFLAIKGDETEHYGWNRMPNSMRRDDHASHLTGTQG